jgi:hypothetical protein
MITIDNENETVMHETKRFIKRSLNAALPAPAFEMSPIMSRPTLLLEGVRSQQDSIKSFGKMKEWHAATTTKL